MRPSYFCFTIAGLAAMSGMSLGIYMGLNGDFALAPVHAHINLLGWVTMALYGLYHRGVARQGNRLAWLQVGCGAAGFALMTGGLAAYLSTMNGAFIAAVIVGALLALTAMVLFLGFVVTDALRIETAPPEHAKVRAFGW